MAHLLMGGNATGPGLPHDEDNEPGTSPGFER